MKNTLWRLSTLVTVLAGLLLTTPARANIYATNIKFNGDRNPVTGLPPFTNSISYILNEPATLGTTVNILSGTNIVRTFSLNPGTNGTWLGSNYLAWDSNDNGSNQVPTGIYTISVTPASSGHTNWTQISRDTNVANFVATPRGLAVDNNSNSLFYGRIFMANASSPPLPSITLPPGTNDTILKLNADGTFSDDGPYGNAGYNLYDDGIASLPFKLRMGDDDRLYMEDFSSYGQIVAMDPKLTTNAIVLSLANYSGNPYLFDFSYGWSSIDVTGAGTPDGIFWMGDGDTNGAGIWYWHEINGIADPNDTVGNSAVPVGNPLDIASTGGLMVDANTNIYVGQNLYDPGDTNAGCMVFTNWNGATAQTVWVATNLLGVTDTTIDSRQKPKYVACALGDSPTTNGVRILNAATGATVTNLDSTNQYFATAWDNVGNLYAATQTAHRLRVFSPPDGTNQATTLAVIHLDPVILNITGNHTGVTIQFLASKADTASDFTLVGSPFITGLFQPIGDTITSLGNGMFSVTAANNMPNQYFQIRRNAGE